MDFYSLFLYNSYNEADNIKRSKKIINKSTEVKEGEFLWKRRDT